MAENGKTIGELNGITAQRLESMLRAWKPLVAVGAIWMVGFGTWVVNNEFQHRGFEAATGANRYTQEHGKKESEARADGDLAIVTTLAAIREKIASLPPDTFRAEMRQSFSEVSTKIDAVQADLGRVKEAVAANTAILRKGGGP